MKFKLMELLIGGAWGVKERVFLNRMKVGFSNNGIFGDRCAKSIVRKVLSLIESVRLQQELRLRARLSCC